MFGQKFFDVKINGNGAVIDLLGEEILISYCENKLDIEDCVIINGNIRYRGINTSDYQLMPIGSVSYVTFFNCHDYAVRVTGAGAGILIENCIAVNSVDTDFDFTYTAGMPLEWLPTGINFAVSVQIEAYGFPLVRDNFSYFYREDLNSEPLHHFTML